ncbi:D-glycerate dehydrogenase [bacterium CPR1]|nr:D-glycerate dehydrogenase [bacterium CPR1]
MRVHVTRPIPRAGLELLEQAGLSYTVPEAEGLPDRSELLRAVAGCTGILSLLTERMDAEAMEAAGPALRVISNHAVGHDNVDVKEATRRGILVTNTPGVLTETTADFTWALMLALARRVAEGDRLVREGKFEAWGPLMLLGTDLAGSTLGVVGSGRIGWAVARRAAGFKMRVLLYSPSRRLENPEEFGLLRSAQWVELDELFQRADFVSLHPPSTPATHHLVDERRLSLMKPTAFLINTSRGCVVDEQALIRALQAGRLAGAALDVYEHEPHVPQELLELPNVLLAPHIASASQATRSKMASLAARNLIDALEGRPPEHMVNPEVWRG